jgi:hypothetical protein
VDRGDVTFWLTPRAIATWSAVGVGKRRGQLQYSDLAIETALTVRLVFRLPLRQTEGFLASIFGMMGVDLAAPDHTTLSRRGQHLGVTLRPVKKLHLGVDETGVIVARALTEPTADDAITGISLVEHVDRDLTRVTADPAYDTLGFYDAAGARGARVVVPPTKAASLSRRGHRSSCRDRTIRRMRVLGRRRWKKASGYHQQARVENAFFRYKSIIGDGLRARSRAGQQTESALACNILNRLTELGRPASYRIGR